MTELTISKEDFKLIKSFCPEFCRAKGIKSNEFIIDWNGLMSVVEKIGNLNGNNDKNSVLWDRIVLSLSAVDQEWIYKNVVKYIKWYNNQPK